MPMKGTPETRTPTRLPAGKIDPELLGPLLHAYTQKDQGVVIGAGIGEDAAVLRLDKALLVAKTDPITHVTHEVGRYAVMINANDLAAMGAEPRFFLAAFLLPEGFSPEELEGLFSQVAETCLELGIAYCGGHTEVTGAVNNPVVVGHMLGEAEAEDLKPSSAARKGDHLLMTRTAAIEATAILATEREAELRGHLSPELLERAKGYLKEPGISVLKEARIARRFKGVHALHDPTEGGIATGIHELARASGLGVEVDLSRIPVSHETRRVCEALCVDPLGAFASGSLLAAVDPRDSSRVLEAFFKAGISAARIGTLHGSDAGMRLRLEDGGWRPLPLFAQDELSRLLG